MAVRERPTLKQARFARAYVEDGNATEAAVKAGYKVKSRTVAAAIGTENLQNPVVQREVETWQARLERNIVPSLMVIEDLRDTCADPRVKLAAGRDLLNRAGVGKAIEKQTNVVNVIATMDETKLLARMAQLAQQNSANPSVNMVDVSHNSHYATQEKKENDGAVQEKKNGDEIV